METRLPDLSLQTFLERLASGDPVPGGGSAAALAGAMGAALIEMVVELTVGRPAAEDHEDALGKIAAAAAESRAALLSLAELDAGAYDAVVRARRLPRGSAREDEARAIEVVAAVAEATRIPLTTAGVASAVLDLAARLAPLGNRNAISDVGVAGLLAATALRGAALNVQINLPSLGSDHPLRRDATVELTEWLASADERERAVRDAVADRLR